MKSSLGNQSGQTAVEYILLLLVVVTMITALAKKFNEHYLSDDGTCEDVDSQSLVCQVQKLWGGDPNFRFFQLRK